MPENENASPMTAEEIFNKLPKLGRDGHYFHISQASVIGAMEKYADQQMKSSLALYENQNQTIIKLTQQLEDAKRENEWISIKDKLPDANEFDAFHKNGYRITNCNLSGIVFNEHESLKNYMNSFGYTHWRLIPKPPQTKINKNEALKKGGNDNG